MYSMYWVLDYLLLHFFVQKKRPGPLPCNTRSLDLYFGIFSYVRSVRKVSLMPPVTSAPECSRSRCWKISTLPTFGSTSNERSMLYEWKVVAPPLSSLAGVDSLR